LKNWKKLNQGYGKTNYRLRGFLQILDPVYYVNGLPQMIDAVHLPIVYRSRKYLPEDGLPPLGNAEVWAWDTATNKVVNTV
jgi:leucyl-tRNA synthetase